MTRKSEQHTEREYTTAAYTDAFAFNRLEADMIKIAYLADQIDIATAEELWRDLRHRFYRRSSHTQSLN